MIFWLLGGGVLVASGLLRSTARRDPLHSAAEQALLDRMTRPEPTVGAAPVRRVRD